MIRMICVEDDPVMRLYLHTRLAAESDIEVVGSVPDIARALEYLCSDDIDVVLLDYQLQGRDGTDLLRAMSPWLSQANPTDNHPAILFCTGFATEDFAARARLLGAQGVVAKERMVRDLVPAIRAVAGGGAWFQVDDQRAN